MRDAAAECRSLEHLRVVTVRGHGVGSGARGAALELLDLAREVLDRRGRVLATSETNVTALASAMGLPKRQRTSFSRSRDSHKFPGLLGVAVRIDPGE